MIFAAFHQPAEWQAFREGTIPGLAVPEVLPAWPFWVCYDVNSKMLQMLESAPDAETHAHLGLRSFADRVREGGALHLCTNTSPPANPAPCLLRISMCTLGKDGYYRPRFVCGPVVDGEGETETATLVYPGAIGEGKAETAFDTAIDAKIAYLQEQIKILDCNKFATALRDAISEEEGVVWEVVLRVDSPALLIRPVPFEDEYTEFGINQPDVCILTARNGNDDTDLLMSTTGTVNEVLCEKAYFSSFPYDFINARPCHLLAAMTDRLKTTIKKRKEEMERAEAAMNNAWRGA